MGETSEMTIYGKFLEDIKYNYTHFEDFAWGEELVDYKITVYKNKKLTIPNYTVIMDDLIKVGLVTVNNTASGMLSIVEAMFDTASEMIYMKENDFNQSWTILRRSIQIGMNISPEKCEENNIRQPEDILILDYLDKGTSKAYVNEQGQIAYHEVNPSSDILSFRSARQSMMDNPSLTYVYSVSGGLVHDKLCEEINNITDNDFIASETFPEGRIWCARCRRINVIRRGCSPLTKQIPFCDYIFRDNDVSLNLVESMIDQGCKFYASDLNCLQVKGIEDNWEIRFTKDGPTLWHNNYIMTSDTERYITEGFHKQKIRGKNVNTMLNCINKYTWEKHLLGEEQKRDRIEKLNTEVQVADRNNESNIFMRIATYIKKIFDELVYR